MHLKQDERLRHIPVIIFSTSINPFEQQKCMELGAHSYITKPVTIEEIKFFLHFVKLNFFHAFNASKQQLQTTHKRQPALLLFHRNLSHNGQWHDFLTIGLTHRT
jgi:CheY-like chemotaxis protein